MAKNCISLIVLSLLLLMSCKPGSSPSENTRVYQLKVNADPAEAGNVSPDLKNIDEGEEVQITATPNNEWVFDSWQGDHTGSRNPVTLTMDSDKTITAMFSVKEYPLTILTAGEGSVNERVIREKTTDYPGGTTVELVANPVDGWRFVGWTGDVVNNENPLRITVDEATEITANFERREYPLTTLIEGEGSVSEEVIQAKTTDYSFETTVELTANPATGWEFVEWNEDLTGNVNPAQITVNDSVNVTAVFQRIIYPLTTNLEGEGEIAEEVVQNKTTDYNSGTEVRVTAIAADGWKFVEWSGDLTGSENPEIITVDEAKEITAIFQKIDYTLTLNISGEGTVDEEIIQTKSTEYPFESIVELTANAAEGWLFFGWEGDLSGNENPAQIDITQDKEVTAVFEQDFSSSMNLSVGETWVQEFPGSAVTLPDQLNHVYRVGVMARDYQFAGTAVAEVSGGFMLRTNQIGVVTKGLISSARSNQTYDDPMIDDEIWDLMMSTEQAHKKLRDAEFSGSAEGLKSITGGESSQLNRTARKASALVEPETNRTFYTSTPDGSDRVEVNATLRKSGTNIIYYQEDSVTGTAEEATDHQIDHLLDYYDQHGKQVIDEMFGGLGPDGSTNHFIGGDRAANDIDGNGKLIVLQLPPEKMLDGAAAYVTNLDRYPTSDNYNAGLYAYDKSNEAEITFMLKPDSDFYLGTLVHEAKHVSSHGYTVFGGRDFQPSWIEEGTAEIAKEMSSRRAAGFSDNQELLFDDIYPGFSTTPETEGMATVHSRARQFLFASPRSGVIGNPDPNSANSSYYGASWLFHRYLADNYALNNQNAFFRELNGASSDADITGIETITGKSFEDLLNEFMQAIQIEGLDAAKLNSSTKFKTYDFEEVSSYTALGDWPYLQTSSDYVTTEVDLSPIYFSSPALFEFSTQSGSTMELELLDAAGNELNIDHNGVIIITRVE